MAVHDPCDLFLFRCGLLQPVCTMAPVIFRWLLSLSSSRYTVCASYFLQSVIDLDRNTVDTPLCWTYNSPVSREGLVGLYDFGRADSCFVLLERGADLGAVFAVCAAPFFFIVFLGPMSLRVASIFVAHQPVPCLLWTRDPYFLRGVIGSFPFVRARTRAF